MSDPTILVVDDDSDVRESSKVLLMEEGFKVVIASDGKKALEEYKKSKIDIVFLDIRMPVMDGYETFFKIKELDHNAKIVFITAFTIEDKRYEEARKNGLIDTLFKPVTLDKMLKVIEKYVQVA